MDLAEAHGITLDHLLQNRGQGLTSTSAAGASVMESCMALKRHRHHHSYGSSRAPGDSELEACPKKRNVLGWRHPVS